MDFRNNNFMNFEMSSRIFEKTLQRLKDKPELNKKFENVIETYESHLRTYFERQESLMYNLMSEEINFKKELNRLVLIQK
jgi:hypothetical protein